MTTKLNKRQISSVDFNLICTHMHSIDLCLIKVTNKPIRGREFHCKEGKEQRALLYILVLELTCTETLQPGICPAQQGLSMLPQYSEKELLIPQEVTLHF